jgi:hypothetical protein
VSLLLLFRRLRSFADRLETSDSSPTTPVRLATHPRPHALADFSPLAVGDDIVAVASMQNDPIAAHVSELFRLNKMLTSKDIKAGKSPLDVSLSA